jgi:hypothetical protein
MKDIFGGAEWRLPETHTLAAAGLVAASQFELAFELHLEVQDMGGWKMV